MKMKAAWMWQQAWISGEARDSRNLWHATGKVKENPSWDLSYSAGLLCCHSPIYTLWIWQN